MKILQRVLSALFPVRETPAESLQRILKQSRTHHAKKSREKKG